VTPDYPEKRMVLNKGGIRVTPQDLKQEIMKTCKNMKYAAVNKHTADSAIMPQTDPKLREKLEKKRRSKF